MYNAVMSEEDKKWQRRNDARDLARAEEIKADKDRYREAIIGAKEIASEEISRVQRIAKIAGMKAPKNNNVSQEQKNSLPMGTRPFDKRGYKNPATLGRI